MSSGDDNDDEFDDVGDGASNEYEDDAKDESADDAAAATRVQKFPLLRDCAGGGHRVELWLRYPRQSRANRRLSYMNSKDSAGSGGDGGAGQKRTLSPHANVQPLRQFTRTTVFICSTA